MDQNNDFSFETELYEAISMLSLWEEGTAKATMAGVMFMADNISGVDEFKAMGTVSLDPRGEEPKPVEFLAIELVLAKDVLTDNRELIQSRLYDVNLGFKQGMFYVDDNRNLCFSGSFPVIRDNVEVSLQLFIAAYIDVMNYIDGVYPYLLRVITHPETSDFTEYIMTLLGEE